MNRLRKKSILTHYFFKPNNFITMAQKNQKQAEKTAKMNESAQAQTQEVETNVAETTNEETQEVEEKDIDNTNEEQQETQESSEDKDNETQEVEEKVPQTGKKETVETPQVFETLESKALKIKKDWNAERIFYCNGQFYATEAEAIKAGTKGFAYYIF